MKRKSDSDTATPSLTGGGSESLGAEFDVFLNFRGPDTRHNFTNHLYHSLDGVGIRVFLDDAEIQKGEKIGGELLHAINNSRIYMPIFSVDYASSAWCLRELATWWNAQEDQRTKFGYDEVQRWKEALTEVASIKGWDCKDRGQGKLIKLITDEVSMRLVRGVRVVPDHLVGIDHHVQNVMHMLGKDTLDVRFVIIYGMGGIGKTTLAKVHDTDFGINMIRGRCCHKKVLIVLDNLDSKDQLGKLAEKCEWFNSGSRIIVTTRDISIFKINKSHASMHPKAYHFYQMKEMDEYCAIQLFSRHAFESDAPPHEYDKITREIVKITGGLPLSLVVIGSSLYCESEEVWDDVLAKLKKMPHKEVREMIGVDGATLWEKVV
ncbi:disease resistance protein RUN1-like [Eucalyptus grandis]|uniref:disease resistance protein RUN1-like n=1 Tax=Eucalyptus grandis TaxID=71139 RepID=UPI00192EE770|nr:disease resistance protein RUN1-like [Eucalyptus grandis]